MKAARIVQPNDPLELVDVDVPHPAGLQVLVKVRTVGVCHSDLHLWEGGYDLGDNTFMKVTDRGVRYPVTPGHEIVGVVHELGPDVPADAVSVGDVVLVYPWVGCGKCPACRAKNENLCDTPRSLGVFQDGGYAQYVLVPDGRYLADVSGIDPDGAASLACSGLTAYTAVKKANTNAPEFLVVIGAGGLGLMAVQIARAITDAKIVCVDMDDEKLAAAQKMGAHHTVNSRTDADTQAAISRICGGGGADSVIDFVNMASTAGLGLSVLKKRGNLVLVGLFGGSLEVPLVTIPLKSITIQGAYTGSYSDMIELLSLAKRGVVNPMISKRYALEQANDALADLKNRKIVGRAVINP